MKKNICITLILTSIVFLTSCQAIIDWSDRVGSHMPTYEKMQQRRAVNQEYQPAQSSAYPAPAQPGYPPSYGASSTGITNYGAPNPPGYPTPPSFDEPMLQPPQAYGQQLNQDYPRGAAQQYGTPNYGQPSQPYAAQPQYGTPGNVPLNQYGR